MSNTLDFSDKVALVTGAAAGMGLATAQAFAEAGAAVVLADVEEDAVNAAAEKLVTAGHKALAVRCNVSVDVQVAAMVDRTVAEFGEARSYWPRGQARGNRVGGAVALQSGGELRSRPCPHRGRRDDGSVIRGLMKYQRLKGVAYEPHYIALALAAALAPTASRADNPTKIQTPAM